MNRHLIGGLAIAVAALGVAMGAQRGANRARARPDVDRQQLVDGVELEADALPALGHRALDSPTTPRRARDHAARQQRQRDNGRPRQESTDHRAGAAEESDVGRDPGSVLRSGDVDESRLAKRELQRVVGASSTT